MTGTNLEDIIARWDSNKHKVLRARDLHEARELLTALSERVVVLEGRDWQPIETAPKDGSLLTLWVEPTQPELVVPAPKTGVALKNNVFGCYPHAQVGYWDAERLAAFSRIYDAPDWAGWSAASSKYQPTHWKPLPEPPALKGCDALGGGE